MFTLSAYLEHLRRGADVATPPADFLSWLSSIGVDAESRRMFAAGWSAAAEDMIGTGFALPPIAMMELAQNEPRWLQAGLLIIGSCGNGDPVALDTRVNPGAIGFLCHEVLWPDPSLPPRDWLVVVADSLSEYVCRASDIDAFPVDYWDAKSAGSSD